MQLFYLQCPYLTIITSKVDSRIIQSLDRTVRTDHLVAGKDSQRITSVERINKCLDGCSYNPVGVSTDNKSLREVLDCL